MGLERYFDFSHRQMWFVGVLVALVTLAAVYLLARRLAFPADDAPDIVLRPGRTAEYTGLLVVDLNTAPIDSLELVDGIGPELARRIDEFRRQHRFNEVAELKLVEGIGDKRYEQLKPYLKVTKP